jgi:hypothetical protein
MKLSVAVSGNSEWPRYLIANGAGCFWNDEQKEWTPNQSDASKFANLYTLKNVVSQIEEQRHCEKRVRCYEGNFVVKIRCDEDLSMSDLHFHLAKCVSIRVHSPQSADSEEIPEAWIGVSLPWETLTEISEEEYEEYG